MKNYLDMSRDEKEQQTFLSVCCCCGLVKNYELESSVQSNWRKKSIDDADKIESHGYCHDDFERELGLLKEMGPITRGHLARVAP